MVNGELSDTEVSSSSECASPQIFNSTILTDQENEYATNIIMTNRGLRSNGDDTFPNIYYYAKITRIFF